MSYLEVKKHARQRTLWQTGRGKLAYGLLSKVRALLSASSAKEACFFAVMRSLGLVRCAATRTCLSSRGLGLAPTIVGMLPWCLSAPRKSGVLALFLRLHACFCVCVHVCMLDRPRSNATMNETVENRYRVVRSHATCPAHLVDRSCACTHDIGVIRFMQHV